jgi:hypothetical protein
VTSEEWLKVKEVVSKAAGISDPDARRVYLDESCAEGSAVRSEVQALLAAWEKASDILGNHRSLVGKTLLNYQLIEKVGEGAAGIVYKARDIRLGRLVVLKVLPALLTGDPESRARFRAEAQCASALNHPNVVTVHGIEEDRDALFIVMEYVPGQTLNRVIPAEGLPIETAFQYASQIADALAKTHAAGIIHRDLKPSNVLVTEDGLIKITDFGLAKALSAPAGHSDLTRHGTILGTAGYMSPEQARGEKADARSDVFAFGALFYEMLTGQQAFKRDSSAETIAAVLKESPPRPDKSVPEPLWRITERCLQKNQNDRFDSMEVVAAELRHTRGAVLSKRATHRRAITSRVAVLMAAGVILAGTVFFLRAMLSPRDLGGGYKDRETPMVSAPPASPPFTGAPVAAAGKDDAAAERFARGIAYETKADKSPCLTNGAAGCDLEQTIADLENGAKEFSAVLQRRPHAGSYWHRGLAYSKLCRLQAPRNAQAAETACRRAIDDFTEALKPQPIDPIFVTALPQEPNVVWNRGLTHLIRARLKHLDSAMRIAAFSAAIGDLDRILAGGQSFAEFLEKRRADVLRHRERAFREREALLKEAGDRLNP